MTTTAASPASSVAGLTAADAVAPDTNVWVFVTSPTAPEHALAVATLDALRAAGVALWTSRQVLREYLAAMTKRKPFAGLVPTAEAVVNALIILHECRMADDGQAVFAELLALLAAVACGGKQVHDANIVATLRVAGVPRLLTHNVKDFKRFAHLVTVLPLVP